MCNIEQNVSKNRHISSFFLHYFKKQFETPLNTKLCLQNPTQTVFTTKFKFLTLLHNNAKAYAQTKTTLPHYNSHLSIHFFANPKICTKRFTITANFFAITSQNSSVDKKIYSLHTYSVFFPHWTLFLPYAYESTHPYIKWEILSRLIIQS